jgi:hypothetical protein
VLGVGQGAVDGDLCAPGVDEPESPAVERDAISGGCAWHGLAAMVRSVFGAVTWRSATTLA